MTPKRRSRAHRAQLHTPEELLDGAEELLALDNPTMRRAAVLEAITALEAFVQAAVFSSLENRLDPLLVRWLEDKTRMDFDSRLSVLTPVATGRPIDKASQLWQDYKKAKTIRNKVTHSGRRVSSAEARFVVTAVYDWLAYLGSTAELEVALHGLKRFVEQDKEITIAAHSDAVRLVLEYFGQTKAAQGSLEVPLQHPESGTRRHADLILSFGDYSVVVEVNFSARGTTGRAVEAAVEQVSHMMTLSDVTAGVAVVFQRGPIEAGFETVRRYRDGTIYVVAIRV